MACLAETCSVPWHLDPRCWTRGGNGQRRMSQNGCSTEPGREEEAKKIRGMMAMEQTSAPPTWACAPVREGVRQSKTGGCRRLGTWSPCVSSDVPLSRVTASPPPPLPGHGIGASGFAHLDLVLHRQIRGVVVVVSGLRRRRRRGKKPSVLLCKTPVSCVPLVAACCGGVRL